MGNWSKNPAGDDFRATVMRQELSASGRYRAVSTPAGCTMLQDAVEVHKVELLIEVVFIEGLQLNIL